MIISKRTTKRNLQRCKVTFEHQDWVISKKKSLGVKIVAVILVKDDWSVTRCRGESLL